MRGPAGIFHRRRAGSVAGGVLVVAAMLALLGLGVWFFIGNRGRGGVSVRYETVSLGRGSLRPTITAIGNLKPLSEITVGSEISGIIRKINVRTNDTVTKGQVIAQIDTERLQRQAEALQAAAEVAKTRVTEAEATLAEAQATHDRNKALFEKSRGTLPSRVRMEAVEADLLRARHALEAVRSDASAALAQLRTVEADLAKTTIKSPVDGVVLRSNFEEGATVAAGYRAPELFVIAEKLDLMKVVVSVAEADIARVKAGQKAVFTVDAWGAKTYDANVTKVEKAATNTSNVITYSVEIQVPNADLSLRAGMTATATIFTEEIPDTWQIPTGALGFSPAGRPRQEARPGNAVIWRLEKNGPEPMEVRTGRGNAQSTEISGAALREGLRIIVGVGEG